MSPKEQLVFKVPPHLVSVDGPDGAGKSKMSDLLAAELEGAFDAKALVVRPTYFQTSTGAQSIGREFSTVKATLQEHSRAHNGFYLTAMEANYRTVVLPAVKTGKIIVLDSSEIRALAFILDKGDSEAIRDTLTRITTGTLTCCLQPRVRVILNASADDLLRNLQKKVELDKGDPHNLWEARRRIRSYHQAIDFIRELAVETPTKWITIEIAHTDIPLTDYMLRIIHSSILPPLQEI